MTDRFPPSTARDADDPSTVPSKSRRRSGSVRAGRRRGLPSKRLRC